MFAYGSFRSHVSCAPGVLQPFIDTCQIFYERFFFLETCAHFPQTRQEIEETGKELCICQVSELLKVLIGGNIFRDSSACTDEKAGKIKPFSITLSSDGACQLQRQHKSSLKSMYRKKDYVNLCTYMVWLSEKVLPKPNRAIQAIRTNCMWH